LCLLLIVAFGFGLFSACGKQPTDDPAGGTPTLTMAPIGTPTLLPSDEPTLAAGALSPTVAPSGGTSPQLTAATSSGAKATPTAKPKATPTAKPKATATAKPTAIPTPTPMVVQPAAFPFTFAAGTRVLADLTGNGTLDTVWVEMAENYPLSDDWEIDFWDLVLHINGQTFTIDQVRGPAPAVTLLQIGKVKMVAIPHKIFGTLHDNHSQFFTLGSDGKILQSDPGIATLYSLDFGYTSEGYLQLWAYTYFVQRWAVRVTYTLTDDLQLVEVPPANGVYQTWTARKQIVETAWPLTLYESRDALSAHITLDVGEIVTLGETDNKEWLRISTADGRTGWLHTGPNVTEYYGLKGLFLIPNPI